MRSSLFRHVIILLCLVPVYCIAQTQEIKFNLINGMNGIFLGKINSITQDKDGVMWFSDQTNRCITQYDGSRMIRYQHNPKDSNTLGGYYPECVYADSNGLIWIGLYGFGLDRFDPVTKTFTHYRHDPKDPKSISNDTVSNILIDHQKNIWIGTNDGINLLDPATGTFKHFKYNAADPGSLSHNVVRALYEDHEGTLWVGTGFAWGRNDLGGLNRFDRNTGTFTRYLHDPGNNNSLINNKVRAIYEDSKGTLWIGTMGDGLHSLDRSTGVITRHPHNPKHPSDLSRPAIKSENDHITFITEDAENCLWIGTLSNGIMRYNPQTKVTNHYTNANSTGMGFKDESGWTAYASTGGWLWISTQESNLYKVEFFSSTVRLHDEYGYTTFSFLDEDNGVQWFTSDKGLIRKNVITGKITTYRNDPLNPKSLSSNWLSRVYKDPDGTIWILTQGGLNRFDDKTQSFTRYVSNASDSTSLSVNEISVLFTDSKFNFWVGTFGGGIHLMNKEKETFTRFRLNESDSTSLGGDIVTSILEGDNNDIWIGTWDSWGVSRMNLQTKKCKRYLQGISVGEILEDSKGNIWVCAVNNLYKYDIINDAFTLYTIGGVPVTINEMKSMVIDRHDNLWIITVAGITRIDTNKDQFIVYGKQNGFNAQDYPYSSANLLSNGEICIGAFEGYYTFDPDKFIIPKGQQRLEFSSFYINGNLIIPGQASRLTAPLKNTKEIRLSHDENVFSFNFSAIDYSPDESKLYYYKLENFDKDWQQTDPNRQLYYFNIPPGSYIMKINSFNTMYGTWVEKDITIIISPPWWKTWWAYTLYALGLVLIGIGIHRIMKAQVLKAEREKNRAHELAQAREIEKAYHQLKTTQSQLIQSEKMASLGELTAGIAHEIQNPLNFINNFAEVNAELIDELKEGIDSNNLTEVKSISRHIRDNEEKIIFHGKRADAIVKGMLQHSRSSSGVKEPTDINALADEYLRLAYHGLRAKEKSFNATMKTDYDQTIGMVNVIPQDIGRVILNLITNAFYAVSEKNKSLASYTPYPLQGGLDYQPTVTVMTKHQLPLPGNRGSEGAKVSISISDNGPGIPKSALDKIFQPFFTTKPTGQGTGLGLSLSYDIVKAHGGELKVETKEGEGTTFTIQLPVS